MRSLSLVVLLLSLTTNALAAPDLKFSAEREQSNVNHAIHFFIFNQGDAAARDLTVTVNIEGSGLEFQSGGLLREWTCDAAATTVTCTTPSFDAGKSIAGMIALRQTDRMGGHRTLTGRLTARDLPPQSFTVDVIANHRITVTSAAGSGEGSLRAAIEEINAQPACGTDVPCLVSFSGPMTIAPSTPLPPIRKCNVGIAGIDDYEHPLDVKQIVISGENATHGNGLHIAITSCNQPGGVAIASLVIHSWPWNGILFDATTAAPATFPHSINQTYVGTDATGLTPKGNGSRGIAIDGPNERVSIYNGISSANGRSGIAAFGGKRVEISNVKIGVGRDGTTPMGNGASGVFSLGVPVRVNFSTIAYNSHYGIALTPGLAEANLEKNLIHSNGALPVDWALDGPTSVDDETDGILNTPRILDAFYDAASNRTTVRGDVLLRAGTFGDFFLVDLYSGVSPRGDLTSPFAINRAIILEPQVPAGSPVNVPFDITFDRDIRGHLVAVQAHGVRREPGGAQISSEISEAVVVR